MRGDRMAIALAAVSLVAALFFTSRPALATTHHHHHRYRHHVVHLQRHRQIVVASLGGADAGWFTPSVPQRTETRRHVRYSTGRPGRWCGWWMRFHNGRGDPGDAYNLARNWAHWGSRAFAAAYGVVVVWPHHVGKIVGACSGSVCLIESGNDGHAVRTRPRDISRAIALRE